MRGLCPWASHPLESHLQPFWEHPVGAKILLLVLFRRFGQEVAAQQCAVRLQQLGWQPGCLPVAPPCALQDLEFRPFGAIL